MQGASDKDIIEAATHQVRLLLSRATGVVSGDEDSSSSEDEGQQRSLRPQTFANAGTFKHARLEEEEEEEEEEDEEEEEKLTYRVTIDGKAYETETLSGVLPIIRSKKGSAREGDVEVIINDEVVMAFRPSKTWKDIYNTLMKRIQISDEGDQMDFEAKVMEEYEAGE